MPNRLSLPLRVTTAGAMATITQDSLEDVVQSVELLLATRPGERRTEPEYGLVDMLGVGFEIDDLTAAIAKWEPRAVPAVVETVLTTLVEQHFQVHPITEEA